MKRALDISIFWIVRMHWSHPHNSNTVPFLCFDFRDCTGSYSTYLFCRWKIFAEKQTNKRKKNCTANVNSSISRKCCFNLVKKYVDSSRIWGLFICLHLVCLSNREIKRAIRAPKIPTLRMPDQSSDVFYFVIGSIYYLLFIVRLQKGIRDIVEVSVKISRYL